MLTSRKTDFRKLKITLVTMTYHSQRPQCPSLSPHVLLLELMFGGWVGVHVCIVLHCDRTNWLLALGNLKQNAEANGNSIRRFTLIISMILRKYPWNSANMNIMTLDVSHLPTWSSLVSRSVKHSF